MARVGLLLRTFYCAHNENRKPHVFMHAWRVFLRGPHPGEFSNCIKNRKRIPEGGGLRFMTTAPLIP